ncbi:hypothetical protein H0H81_005221 [Sphagnurus paluster]|uniref:Fe2OG dioxygenase domain-containing protein n=1 Tax=Sphagnurus paluster TaxID=117069 RepID=A0A9P7FYQ5_9AGAR|nr:hypothetical protein H0H81_005221 [Sphagnurus paluster]
MGTTSKSILNSLEAAITRKPPFCTGIIPITSEHASLSYKRGEIANWLDLSQATPSQLQALAEACVPASFGFEQREDHHRAGKMDKTNFLTSLDLANLGIVDRVRQQLLYGPDDGKYVKAGLSTLNVYGPNSPFESTKTNNTPLTDNIFGSLIVIFPTLHKGATLKLSRDDEEWIVDSTVLTQNAPSPSITYIAFHRGADHEVIPVTAGYRVTLTYNLFLDPNPGKALSSSVQAVTPDADVFHNALLAALDNPSALPDGGYLGFGVSYKYDTEPVDADRLKGSDAMIFRVCEDLSLAPSLNAVYNSGGVEDVLVSTNFFLSLDGVTYEDVVEVLCDHHEGKIIVEGGKENGISRGRRSWPIAKMCL